MEKILDYITNNITENPGSNVPQFPTPSNIYGDVFTDLGTYLTTATDYRVLGNIFDETTQNILFYGYYTDGSQYYGFIYITDDNLEKVQLITQFQTGGYIFPILAMNQDESGYMYALSSSLGDTNVMRVLLFNNLLIPVNGNYFAKLRASYIIPNSSEYNPQIYDKNKIVKVPGEATYYIPVRNGTNNYTTIVEFINNVGMENEWNTYDMDDLYNLSRNGTLVEKDGDNVSYYFYGLSASNTPNEFVKWKLHNGNLVKLQVLPFNYTTNFIANQVFVKDNENVYLSVYDTSDTTYKLFKVEDNGFTEIYTFTNPNASYVRRLSLELQNNIVFLKQLYRDASANGKVKLGILQDDTVYLTSEQNNTTGNSYWDYVLCPTVSNYNLAKLYAPSSQSKRFTFDYNHINYNGAETTGYAETTPSKARLYSNGSMVFARNLYNLTLNGATATATVQVPNTLINGVAIDQEDLVGKTNSVLITDDEEFTKNIYETLYVNFIRTLTVIDEDTNTLYPLTASYINQNINNGSQQNCLDTFVGKARINYANDSVFQSITWTWSTDHYETSFVVDAVSESPTTIDFMSNDETTIYITKQMSLTLGSYYLVSQKLRIE